MRSIIIYQSTAHSNTEKIAKVLSKAFNCDMVKPHQVDIKSLHKYDLIGFGSGIYFNKYHKSILQFLSGLPKFNNKNAFIFSTSGMREFPIFHKFNRKITEMLLDKGFKILGKLNLRGYDNYGFLKLIGGINKGRPNNKDFKKAEDFANYIKNIMV